MAATTLLRLNSCTPKSYLSPKVPLVAKHTELHNLPAMVGRRMNPEASLPNLCPHAHMTHMTKETKAERWG